MLSRARRLHRTNVSTNLSKRFAINGSSSLASKRRLTTANSVSEPSPLYYTSTYWNERYSGVQSNHGLREWYCCYADVQPKVEQYIPKNARVLNVGCGDSEFSLDMALDGYSSTNIDFAIEAIRKIEKTIQKAPLEVQSRLKYLHMDATKMTFTDNSFDAIIDKGCLDSMMTADDPMSLATLASKEYHRVLVPDGILMLISFNNSSYLNRLFTNRDWTLLHSSLEHGYYLHFYAHKPYSSKREGKEPPKLRFKR